MSRSGRNCLGICKALLACQVGSYDGHQTVEGKVMSSAEQDDEKMVDTGHLELKDHYDGHQTVEERDGDLCLTRKVNIFKDINQKILLDDNKCYNVLSFL